MDVFSRLPGCSGQAEASTLIIPKSGCPKIWIRLPKHQWPKSWSIPSWRRLNPGRWGSENDLWTITGEFICRHHVVPRVKLYMPHEETFPVRTKYIDVTRTTHASLDVLMEKQIEEYWNVDGERELSDAWTGFTRIILLNERPPEGYTWSWEETYKETKIFSSCRHMARYVEIYVRCSEKESKTQMGHREAKAR